MMHYNFDYNIKIICYLNCMFILNSLILNKFLGKKNLEEYTKKNVFNLPTKTFIENYMKSFCDDPFNDEFAQSLVKSDIK